MAITLAEMREGMSDKVTAGVIDTFLQESVVLQDLPFDDAVTAAGGSTLTYGYVQEKTPGQSSFRALNTEYTPNQATVEKKTTDLKVFGGAFQIDRVLKQAEGMYNNVAFQVKKKVQTSVATFHDSMINGDSAVDANAFDGLDKFLVGSETEYNTDGTIDLSTQTALIANASAFYEKLKKLISVTGADALYVNEDMALKIETVAAHLGYKTESEDAFGRKYTAIASSKGAVKICDLGNVVNAEGKKTPIIGVDGTGLTDIYAVHYSVDDGFHGVTLTGNSGVTQYLPDFTKPGAVKTGEVEMVACVALKKTDAAGVLRNVKIR